MMEVPQDVVGVIMEFFSSELQPLHRGPARVSTKWHSAFLDHEPIWIFFCKQRWPKSPRTDLTLNVFRQRRLVEKSCAPVPAADLTEIENCGFEFAFQCPMVAEKLRVTDQGTDSKPILHCDACDKKVYTCGNLEELASNVDKGRCVSFSRDLRSPKALIFDPRQSNRAVAECFILWETENQKEHAEWFIRLIASSDGPRSQITLSDGSRQQINVPAMVSPTFNPLLVALSAWQGQDETNIEVNLLHFASLAQMTGRNQNERRTWVVALPDFVQPRTRAQLDVISNTCNKMNTNLVLPDHRLEIRGKIWNVLRKQMCPERRRMGKMVRPKEPKHRPPLPQPGNGGTWISARSCPSGHHLVQHAQFHAWICDGCDKEFKSRSMHCTSGCDYDLCQECDERPPRENVDQCPKGHPLAKHKNVGSWICDLCDKSYAAGQFESLRCETCDFDVCTRCNN